MQTDPATETLQPGAAVAADGHGAGDGATTASVAAPNVLREGLRRERVAPPCALVIFGASGDLTSRKLVPSLYELALQRLLPPEFAVVGCSRHPYTDEEFRAELRTNVEEYARTRPVRPDV